jgi:hypothetical protein
MSVNKGEAQEPYVGGHWSRGGQEINISLLELMNSYTVELEGARAAAAFHDNRTRTCG